MSGWKRVTRQEPCPVCQKPDWCGVSEDGAWAVCMRTDSGRASKNGGWLHRLKDSPPPPRFRPPPTRGKNPLASLASYHAALRLRWDWVWLDGLSLSLGVDMDALERLRPAYDPASRAFAFPMRDGDGNVVGLRLRDHEGRKWAVRGGADGLFYDPGMGRADEIAVCEGPTDTAAALTLGLCAVGRPSCASGAEALRALVRRTGCRSVTVVADHDAPKRRPDGGVFTPGLDGARALVKALGRRVRIVLPPEKDLRAWLAAGATREDFDVLAKSATWRLG